MDKTVWLAVVRSLSKLLREGPQDPMFGICFNLDALLREKQVRANGYIVSGYAIVESLAMGWPKHTGMLSFPVPHSGGELWEGKDLELRQELLQYMLDKAWRCATGNKEPRIVQILSERSLRRYRAAGYQIEEKWAGEWHPLLGDRKSGEANARFRCGAPLRAVEQFKMEDA